MLSGGGKGEKEDLVYLVLEGKKFNLRVAALLNGLLLILFILSFFLDLCIKFDFFYIRERERGKNRVVY